MWFETEERTCVIRIEWGHCKELNEFEGIGVVVQHVVVQGHGIQPTSGIFFLHCAPQTRVCDVGVIFIYFSGISTYRLK